jgi:hypothetical protein
MIKEQAMKNVPVIIAVLAMAIPANATFTYTYGLGTNFASMDLVNSQSMLVNGGGA